MIRLSMKQLNIDKLHHFLQYAKIGSIEYI